MPELFIIVEKVLVCPLMTDNERALIESYRRITQGRNPPVVMRSLYEVVALVMV